MRPGRIILTTVIVLAFLTGAIALVLFVRADWREQALGFIGIESQKEEVNENLNVEIEFIDPIDETSVSEEVKEFEFREEDYNECFFLSETSAVCEYKTYTFLKEYDSDQDALNIAYEKMLGTDPYNRDTDGDGVSDGLEMADRTSPTDPKNEMPWDFKDLPKEYQQSDKDYDGLRDEWEELFGLEKGNADTDGDGYLDGEEIIRGFNPKEEGGVVYDAKTTLEWVQDHEGVLETTTVLWKLPQ